MAWQGGRVQLEQSDMHRALNMAKSAEGRCLCAEIEEMQYLIKNTLTEVREGKKWGVEFPRQKKVKATIERLPAMRCYNHPDRGLPSQNRTTNNLHIPWRCTGTVASPPDQCRLWTPERTPSEPQTPPAPPGNNAGAHPTQIINVLARYVYCCTSPPWAEFYTLDAYTQDSQHNSDFDSDMLTDDGTSTG